VIGFGKTENNETAHSNVLKRADFEIVSHEKCFQTSNEPAFWKYLIPGETFCAGSKNGTAACKGDSGGSLAVKIKDRWFLRGIVSLGGHAKQDDLFVGCNANQYTIFVDVANYLPWIFSSLK